MKSIMAAWKRQKHGSGGLCLSATIRTGTFYAVDVLMELAHVYLSVVRRLRLKHYLDSWGHSTGCL